MLVDIYHNGNLYTWLDYTHQGHMLFTWWLVVTFDDFHITCPHIQNTLITIVYLRGIQIIYEFILQLICDYHKT